MSLHFFFKVIDQACLCQLGPLAAAGVAMLPLGGIPVCILDGLPSNTIDLQSKQRLNPSVPVDPPALVYGKLVYKTPLVCQSSTSLMDLRYPSILTSDIVSKTPGNICSLSFTDQNDSSKKQQMPIAWKKLSMREFVRYAAEKTGPRTTNGQSLMASADHKNNYEVRKAIFLCSTLESIQEFEHKHSLLYQKPDKSENTGMLSPSVQSTLPVNIVESTQDDAPKQAEQAKVATFSVHKPQPVTQTIETMTSKITVTQNKEISVVQYNAQPQIQSAVENHPETSSGDMTLEAENIVFSSSKVLFVCSYHYYHYDFHYSSAGQCFDNRLSELPF